MNPFVLPDLGQVDPRELNIAVPVRWLDWPAEKRPYASPDEEFIRSPYQVTAAVLRDRWMGVFDERDLQMWTETADLRAKRFDWQEKLSKAALSTSYAGDVEFVSRRLDREIIEISHLIESITQELNAKFEYKKGKGAGMGPLGYGKMPMTVESEAKLIQQRLKASERLSELLGLATRVVQVNVNLQEEPLHEKMRRLMSSTDPEYAALQRVMAGEILPRGALTASQGEAMEASWREEKDRGRVIDGAVLPRLERNDV